jgi:hypothetical protein
MSITSRCTECGAESSGSGGIAHATTCSAITLEPKLNYGQRAPAIELKFGSEVERKKFMKQLKGQAGGNGLVGVDFGRSTEPVESAQPNTIDSPQEGADLGASARSDEAKTALSRQVATSISGAYHDGYRDGYQTAKHEFEAQSIRKLENEKYQ